MQNVQAYIAMHPYSPQKLLAASIIGFEWVEV